MNRKRIRIPALLALLLPLAACSYDEEPARTSDATTSYVVPKGELPTAEERAFVEAAIEEYNQSIKTTK